MAWIIFGASNANYKTVVLAFHLFWSCVPRRVTSPITQGGLDVHASFSGVKVVARLQGLWVIWGQCCQRVTAGPLPACLTAQSHNLASKSRYSHIAVGMRRLSEWSFTKVSRFGNDGIYQTGGSLSRFSLSRSFPLSHRDGCVVIGKSNRSQPSVLLFATRRGRQAGTGREEKEGTMKSP